MKIRMAAIALIGVAAAGVFRSSVSAQQADAAKNVWSGIYSEAQAKKGEAVYLEMCANCHGTEMEGMDMSPPLSGPAFSANWDQLSVGDLFERIRISMPADKPGTMTRAQIAEVTAYMFKFNKFPEGKEDMPQDVPVLKQILILAEKPAPAH